jgi:hypothetical protein
MNDKTRQKGRERGEKQNNNGQLRTRRGSENRKIKIYDENGLNNKSLSGQVKKSRRVPFFIKNLKVRVNLIKRKEKARSAKKLAEMLEINSSNEW